jgi:hypothetical protein
MYRNIGNALTSENRNRGGLSRIDVPAPTSEIGDEPVDPKTWQGPWRAITDPEEMGFYICQSNAKQYNQAENTPFASGYLADYLGNVLTSKESEILLKGKLQMDLDGIPFPEMKKILQFIATAYQQPMQPCSGIIIPSAFISNYKAVQEKNVILVFRVPCRTLQSDT